MSLIDSLRRKPSKFHLLKLASIDAFDFSHVADKVGRDLGGVTESYLKQGIQNLKRYYVVALLDPANRHAVSKPVDPFWHAHTLHSQEYIRFCRSIYGLYIHHAPLDPNDKQAVAYVRKLYVYTLQCYRKLFKEVDKDWWPELDDGVAGAGEVCTHQEVASQLLKKHALFRVNPALSRRVPKAFLVTEPLALDVPAPHERARG